MKLNPTAVFVLGTLVVACASAVLVGVGFNMAAGVSLTVAGAVLLGVGSCLMWLFASTYLRRADLFRTIAIGLAMPLVIGLLVWPLGGIIMVISYGWMTLPISIATALAIRGMGKLAGGRMTAAGSH